MCIVVPVQLLAWSCCWDPVVWPSLRRRPGRLCWRWAALRCSVPPLHKGVLRQEDRDPQHSAPECRNLHDCRRTPNEHNTTYSSAGKPTLLLSQSRAISLTLFAVGVRFGWVARSFLSFSRSLVFPGCTSLRSLKAFSRRPSDFFNVSLAASARLTASVDFSYDFWMAWKVPENERFFIRGHTEESDGNKDERCTRTGVVGSGGVSESVPLGEIFLTQGPQKVLQVLQTAINISVPRLWCQIHSQTIQLRPAKVFKQTTHSQCSFSLKNELNSVVSLSSLILLLYIDFISQILII